MSFKVIYATEVYYDIQQAVDFYNPRKKGLGTRFFKLLKIRYQNKHYHDYCNLLRFSKPRNMGGSFEIENQSNEYTHHRHPWVCREQFSFCTKRTAQHLRISVRKYGTRIRQWADK